jgi:lipopolysaccharide export system permease protein
MAAPRILWRYIGVDVARHALLGLCVATLVLVVQNVLRLLDRLFDAGVGLGELLELCSIVLPSYLPFAIPTALLFGVLVSFGRMAADGEVVAMRASGISVWRMLPPVLALATLCAALSAYLVFEVEPRGRHRLTRFAHHISQGAVLSRPGQFRELGDQTLWVRALGPESCPLQGVLIGDFSDEHRTRYVSARCGAVRESAGATLVLELSDGSIHFDDTGSDRYRLIRFVSASTAVSLARYLDPERRAREHTFRELLELDRRFRAGERFELRGEGHLEVRLQIQRALAFPLASLALALLAVPLGIRPVRAGRSWGAITAIAAMALYWGLSRLTELAAEAQWLAPEIALWLPNLAVAGGALYLLRRSASHEA